MVDWSGGAVGPGIGSGMGGGMAGARQGVSIDDIGAWYAANIDPNLSQASTGTSLADLISASETEGELQSNLASILGTMGRGGLSQNYGKLSGALGDSIALGTDPVAAAEVEKNRRHAIAVARALANQKAPFNQELENFAQTIGKTAQTLNTQDMQAFDKAQLAATGQSWSQRQRAFVDDKNRQVQNSRSQAYSDAIAAWANRFAGQPITQGYQTIDQFVGPYAYDQEAMQQMMAQRHGSDLTADTDSGWDNLAFGPDTPMGNVSFGGQDEGMPAYNQGWDPNEFARLSGEEQADAEVLRAEGGGQYLLPRKKKRAYLNAFEGVSRPKKKRNIYQDSAAMGWT